MRVNTRYITSLTWHVCRHKVRKLDSAWALWASFCFRCLTLDSCNPTSVCPDHCNYCTVVDCGMRDDLSDSSVQVNVTLNSKRPWSFCQKCRWQVTAKCTYTSCMWLCMKWHGAWFCCVHRTCRDGSSFKWHQPCQRCKYTTSVYIQKRAIKS